MNTRTAQCAAGVVFSCILFLLSGPLNAQENSDPSFLEIFWDDFLIFSEDGIAYYTGPLRWSDSDWLEFGAVAGAHGVMIGAADDEVRSFWLRNQGSEDLTEAMRISGHYGDVFIGTVVAGGVYLTGLFAGNDDIRIAGRMLSETLIYSGLLTMGLRIIGGRSRPFSNDPALEFTWFSIEHDFQAFPSGHATVAFGFSAIVAGLVDETWLSIVLYSAAATMGISRLYLDSHWLSDVTSGAYIGISAGNFVLDRERQRRGLQTDTGENRFSIAPTFNGLHISYRLN